VTGSKIEIEVEVTQTGGGMAKVAADLKADAARAGQAIAQEMDQAAQRSERAFDGVGAKIGRKLEDIPPPRFEDRIVPAAKQAGDKASDVMGQAMGDLDFNQIGSSVGGGLQSILGGAAGPIGAAGAAIGLAFGEQIATGLERGMNARRNAMVESVRSGLDEQGMATVGQAAGAAWSAGFGEGLADVRESALLLQNTFQDLDASFNLEQATRSAEALASVFKLDMRESIEVARDLVTNGLAPDTVTAFAQIADAAQKYQLDIGEILSVMNEFSPVFGKLGVDGSTAFNLIGTMVKEGLVTNVDRAAELFEEFNIEMTDGAGRARPVIEKLGLSFEDLQDKIADGRGAEALAEVAAALLNVGDEAKRNEMAVTLFGAAIESSADPQRSLELLTMADAAGEVGTALDDATDAAENSVSGFEKLQRAVEEGTAAYGSMVDRGLSEVIDAHGFFQDTANESLRWLTGLTQESDRNAAANEANAAAVQADADEIARWNAFGAAWEKQLDEATASTNEATDAVSELDAAFSNLSAQFDGDQIMRNFYEEVDRATEETKELTGATFNQTDGFNVQTAAGRSAQEQLENISLALFDVAQGNRDGSVSSRELASAQAAAESQVRATAGQIGANEAQTQLLINTYARVPANVDTKVNESGNALSRTATLVARLRSLDGRTATTYVRTVSSYVPATNYRSGRPRADGGHVAEAAGGGFGVPVQVNERGRELARVPEGDIVDLPTGSTVITAEDSARFLGEAGGAGPTIVVNIHGGVVLERELKGMIADGMRRGGIDQRGRNVP
jgi:hypothetical protein